MKQKILNFFDNPFFKNQKNINILWLIVTIIAVSPKFFRDDYNNYRIYKGVFWHILNQTNLYTEYPAE
jgi:hypothetical protein